MVEESLMREERVSGNLGGGLQKTEISRESIVHDKENIERIIDRMKEMDYIHFVIMCREFIENNLDLIYIKLNALDMMNTALKEDDEGGE